jgi:hypothetical protein
MNKLSKIWIAGGIAALMAGCGGGGGSAGSSPFGSNGGASGPCPASSAASGAGATCATAANLTLLLDTASIQNTACHGNRAISRLPQMGARMGETPRTRIISANSRAASSPDRRSRTTARAITIPAQAPIPCTNRATTSTSTDPANAAQTDPATNSANPASSGRRRPWRSDSGP